MTNNLTKDEKIALLSSYNGAKLNYEKALQSVEKIHALAEGVTMRLAFTPKGGDLPMSGQERYADKLLEAEAELNRSAVNFGAMIAGVEEALARLDEDGRKVLELRYIKNMQWRMIAYKTHRSIRKAQYDAERAIKNFNPSESLRTFAHLMC